MIWLHIVKKNSVGHKLSFSEYYSLNHKTMLKLQWKKVWESVRKWEKVRERKREKMNLETCINHTECAFGFKWKMKNISLFSLFLLLLMGPTVLFQLTFTFIYSTFSNNFFSFNKISSIHTHTELHKEQWCS